MLVLHGWWDDALTLWAEDPAPRRGRRAAGSHPFAASKGQLAQALGLPPDSAGEPSTGRGGAAVGVQLPTAAGVPLASPELVPVEEEPDRLEPDWLEPDRPEPERPGAGPELARWRVPVLRLAPADALPLLRGMLAAAPGAQPAPGPRSQDQAPPGLTPGSDLRQLALLAVAADDLARRGRVLPSVTAGTAPRGGGTNRARARWLPVLTGSDAEAVRALTQALPPAARAPGRSDRETVGAALDALTDAAVRARLRRAGLHAGPGRSRSAARPAGTDPVPAWRRALTADDPWFELSPDQLTGLTDQLASWQADAVAGPVRVQFRLVEPPADESDQGRAPRTQPGWTVEFGLQPADQPSVVVSAERVWRSPAGLAALARHVPDPQETLLAELGRALRLYPGLAPALRTAHPVRLELDPAGAHAFLREGAPALAAAGFGVLLPTWWGRPGATLGVRARASTPAQPGATTTGPAFGQDALIDFRWEVALGDQTLTGPELAALAELSAPLVRIRGQWVELDSQRLRNGLKLVQDGGAGALGLVELLRVVADGTAGPGDLPIVGVAADGWLGDLLAGAAPARIEPVEVAASFTGSLRGYQQRGLAWLTFLQRIGLGAVLADDMGLGKTVQLLALLAGDAAGSPPTLLVCPMSLVGNWQREAARFTPGLRVHVHHGAERPRGKAFREAVASCDMVVTTYALAARDAAALSGVGWRRLILDEAQAVKNAATKAATAVRAIPAQHRIAVTGTPVENRLADLWSLMEFANPGLLGSAAAFRRRYATPIERHRDADASARLRTLTQPFLLRRVKTDREIIADLPEKLEMEVICGLTREQASLYQAVVDDMLARIADTEGMQRRGLVLATMTRLKQVCNHPAQLLRDGSRLAGRSGKLARLEETLEEVLAAGEKALLFTQFAQFGAMLRAHLSARFGREVAYLHGGVAKDDRDAMVARFQSTATSGPALFVLSLKAGGTGLTLTRANHVIHVDRWWNPAVEDQATDRAFRIGQTRNVQVRKLVCGGTLEERISTMIRDKRGLAASIVGTGEGWLTELSTDALRDLIRLDPDGVVE